MASVYKEFIVDAPPRFVWEAIKDVGAVHTRLAQGFVTDTQSDGKTRTVTFANGLVVHEQIVSLDDELCRFVYHAYGGQATHHNGCFQVFPVSSGRSRILWVTDLLPDELRGTIEQLVEQGSVAIRATLEKAYRGS